jgi:hypothetical protein
MATYNLFDGYGNEYSAGVAQEVVNRIGAKLAREHDVVVVAEPDDTSIFCRAYDPEDGKYWEVPHDWCDRLERGETWGEMSLQ